MPAHRPIVKLTAFCWLVSFLAVPLGAQNPAAPTEAEKQGLESFKKWHEEAGKIKKMKLDLKITKFNTILNEKQTHTGSLIFRRESFPGDQKKNLYVKIVGEDTKSFHFLIDGTYYRFSHDSEYVEKAPDPSFNRILDTDPLYILGKKFPRPYSGLINKLIGTFDNATKNYIVKLRKEDKYYIYLDILGKSKEGRGDYIELVLNKSNHLPRRIFYCNKIANIEEVMCEINNLNLNPDLKANDFPKPTPEFFGNRSFVDLEEKEKRLALPFLPPDQTTPKEEFLPLPPPPSP